MKRSDAQRRMVTLCCVVTLLALALPGCIVHGDYVRLREFRGTLVDAASGEPLAATPVRLTTSKSSTGSRAGAYPTTTDDDGCFTVDAVIGGGSITWFLLIPIVREASWDPPEVIYIELEERAKSARLEVPLSSEVRERIRAGESTVELGKLEVRELLRTTD